MSIDGQFPRIFATVNKHGVPGFSMGFNVACSIALVFTGGAVEIYTLSNVGYTASFIPVLVGYYLLRKNRPDMRRPVRMPEFFKYIALILAASYFVIWSYGGLVEASLPNALLGGNDTKVYFFIGWAILAQLRVLLLVPRQGGGPEARDPGRRRPSRRRSRPATDGPCSIGWGRCSARHRPHPNPARTPSSAWSSPPRAETSPGPCSSRRSSWPGRPARASSWSSSRASGERASDSRTRA